MARRLSWQGDSHDGDYEAHSAVGPPCWAAGVTETLSGSASGRLSMFWSGGGSDEPKEVCPLVQ
jgi:hypothetical protein